MIKIIDNFLNKITMYRLVLYYLIILLLAAIIFSVFSILPYAPINIFISVFFLLLVCKITNNIFSQVFLAPVNIESVYISALILALIITPAKSISDLIFLFWAAVLSTVSKYILAINKKHIFNPVAIAVVVTSFAIGKSASWWVGNLYLTPFVLIGGLLLVRKIRREEMINSFIVAFALTIAGFSIINRNDLTNVIANSLFHSSLFFFAFVMLTEPLTTPPTKKLQNIYGVLTGILFAPQINFLGIFSTPELTLIVGNIFTYLVSPKEKLLLKLDQKIQISPDTYDFIFPLQNKFNFIPGQYMEWTKPHDRVDDRGNRRYFTLASSPTEDNLRIGIKFYQPASSYKKSMLEASEQNLIVASGRAGDFTMPKDKSKKLVFIAGGIGITPFRSMLKYLIDLQEKRNIVVFYSNRKAEEIVYQDVLEEAKDKLNIKIIYTLTDKENIPPNWKGKTERINEHMIQDDVPDFRERLFYISGPNSLVQSFKEMLIRIGIKEKQIVTDYFPGFV